jgi:hypothetical protein
VNRKHVKQNAPLIRWIPSIFFGVLIIAATLVVLVLPGYKKLSDYLCAIGFAIFGGGLGGIILMVGIKKRKW